MSSNNGVKNPTVSFEMRVGDEGKRGISVPKKNVIFLLLLNSRVIQTKLRWTMAQAE